MKLNNKGITLTEIIISIALIAIVLVFLASLLVTVNDINKESATNSTYLIGKSLLIKNIENDLKNAASLTITECSVTDIYSTYNETDKPEFCYIFDYGSGDIAKLGLFFYDKSNTYIISYVHGDIRTRMELPDFEENNVNGSNFKKSIVWNNNPLANMPTGEINGFFTMTIPIIGEDGKDYSIIISYYGK